MSVPHVCMADTYIYMYIYMKWSEVAQSCPTLCNPMDCIYIYIYIYIYINIHTHTHIFIHSSVVRQVGCFHIFAVVNSAAMNIVVNVSFWIIALSGYMPRSGIANSYGNFLVFLRILHTVFHSGCINSHQQCMRFRFLHPLTSICYL